MYLHICDAFYKAKEVIEFNFIKKESKGTIKFFIIATLLVLAIKNEYLLIIDKLNSKFHSDLLGLLVKNFHSSEINNSSGSVRVAT